MNLFFHQISSDNSSQDEDISSVNQHSSESNFNSFVSPSPTYHLSMDQHLSHITTKISQSATPIRSRYFSDEDFLLDQMNKPFKPMKKEFLVPVSIVICAISHPQFYPKRNSRKNMSSFIFWKNLISSDSQDFLGTFAASYKTEYARLLPLARFLPFVSPTVEKLNTIPTVRNESGDGRSLFHYVGYGFPQLSKSSLNLIDGCPENMRPYHYSKLFEILRPPSWFIFDCDNAEIALNGLLKASKESISIDSTKSHDWFCFCATSIDEELPIDPNLPRDFFTSCLFTPISLSILCHILQYYRTTFLNISDFPFSHFEEFLLASNDKQLDLTLSTIIDSIAVCYLSPTTYRKLFYQDKFTSWMFRHFLLAQFLLAPYDVHPVSYPEMPNTASHPLWHQWQATLDLWITSTTTPKPSFATNFFNRSVTTFQTFLSNDKTKSKIDLSLLTILARYPTTRLNGCDRAFILLSEYASENIDNRKKIAEVIAFNDLFSKLISFDSNNDEYHSLAYLVLSLLQLDLNFESSISNNLNFAILPTYLFDTTISEDTRSLLSAILASIVIFNKTLKGICASSAFINETTDAIRTAQSSQLILWLLILLKRSFSIMSADFSCFYNASSHLQIAVCLFHKMSEIRAAATSALSCFMQSIECMSNLHLILFAVSLYDDASYLVRHQLILLLSRFLSSTHSQPSLITLSSLQHHSFGSLFLSWMKTEKVPANFNEYAAIVDKIAHLDDSINYIIGIVHFLIEYFTHDPHPAIQSLAKRIKSYLYDDTKSSTSYSISPPFTALHIRDNSFEEDEFTESEIKSIEDDPQKQQMLDISTSYESDSDALYNISVRHLVNTPQRNIEEASGHRIREIDAVLGNINLPVITLKKTNEMNNLTPVKMCYHPKMLQAVIATSQTPNDRKPPLSTQPTLANQKSLSRSSLYSHDKLKNKPSTPPSSMHSPLGPMSLIHTSFNSNLSSHELSKHSSLIQSSGSSISSFPTVQFPQKSWLYTIDEDMNILNKLALSNSIVSDLSYNILCDEPVIGAATCDGCCTLWFPSCRNAFASWRADINYMNDNIPLYAQISSANQTIATTRGSNGLNLWDLKSMQLIGEWPIDDVETKAATSLAIHPGNQNVCTIGFDNGGFTAIDTRVSNKETILTVSIGESIIGLRENKVGANLIYAATKSGRCLAWDMSTNNLTPCGIPNPKLNVHSFDASLSLPILGFSSIDDHPIITTPNGQSLYKVEDVAPNSIISFHPVLPFVTFGTAGHVQTFSIQSDSHH